MLPLPFVVPPEVSGGIVAVIAAALAWAAHRLRSASTAPAKPAATLDDVVRILTEISDRQDEHGRILLRLEDRSR